MCIHYTHPLPPENMLTANFYLFLTNVCLVIYYYLYPNNKFPHEFMARIMILTPTK